MPQTLLRDHSGILYYPENRKAFVFRLAELIKVTFGYEAVVIQRRDEESGTWGRSIYIVSDDVIAQDELVNIAAWAKAMNVDL